MFRSAVLITGFCLLGCGPSLAFWERSQVQACKEAPTPIEREPLRCRVFAPVYEWPAPIAGAAAARLQRALPPRVRK